MSYTKTYKSWDAMKQRCRKHPKGYENVTYVERWEDFRNFYADMGDRPDGMTLDRIDPRGNYCKENCRWADYETQENNRKNNVKYLFQGGLLTIPQIARMTGINKNTLYDRVRLQNLSIEQAVNKNTSHLRKKNALGGIQKQILVI
ncbi:MAG: hypothetical protein NC489_29120 [Ruminococcus flavefaciens]|nr:hypothetical protein [Ruminococcus flavefaciens]